MRKVFNTIESFDNTGYFSWGDYQAWHLEFLKAEIVKRYGQDSCSPITTKLVDIRMHYEKNKKNSAKLIKNGLPILNILYKPKPIMKPIMYFEVYKNVDWSKLGKAIGVHNSSRSSSSERRRNEDNQEMARRKVGLFGRD